MIMVITILIVMIKVMIIVTKVKRKKKQYGRDPNCSVTLTSLNVFFLFDLFSVKFNRDFAYFTHLNLAFESLDLVIMMYLLSCFLFGGRKYMARVCLKHSVKSL